jgi:hypothetical protein
VDKLRTMGPWMLSWMVHVSGVQVIDVLCDAKTLATLENPHGKGGWKILTMKIKFLFGGGLLPLPPPIVWSKYNTGYGYRTRPHGDLA